MTDYRVQVKDPKYIGHGTMSPEGTGDVQYLCRAANVSYKLLLCDAVQSHAVLFYTYTYIVTQKLAVCVMLVKL